MGKQTFQIPQGCNKISIEQIENTLVTTFEQEFKKGDIITYKEGSIIIFDSIGNNNTGMTNHDYFSDRITFISKEDWKLSTESEKQLLFSVLAKENKQWNSEKLCIEPLKVLPKVGDFVKYQFEGRFGYFISGEIKNDRVYQKGNTSVVDSRGRIFGKENLYSLIPFDESCRYEILTSEQFQTELNALGFVYNFEDDTITGLKWEPKYQETVYAIVFTKNGLKGEKIAYSNGWKSQYYNGFIFKTESECQAKIDQIKNILK